MSRALSTADLKGERGPISPRKGCGWLCVCKARVTPQEVQGKLGSGKVHARQRGDTRGRRRAMLAEHDRDAERAAWGRGTFNVSAQAPQSDRGWWRAATRWLTRGRWSGNDRGLGKKARWREGRREGEGLGDELISVGV